MGRYLVFDSETTIIEKHKRKANPFCLDNWVVMRGWKLQGDEKNSWVYYPEFNRTSYLHIPDDVTYLVGFNIKFDLLWEMAQNNPSLQAFFARGGKIWCGQYAEYLLEGMVQEVHMVSMDGITEKYGGTLKNDEVKAMWEIGINTCDIPEDLLTDYLVGTEEEQRAAGDIGNTEKIFLGQLKAANKLGMLKMIQDRMDGLMATTEMEFNGLKIDVAEAARRLQILKNDLQVVADRLNENVSSLPWEFNWGSPIQVSSLLFGGTVKYKVREGYLDEDGQPARSKAFEQWPMVAGEAMSPAEFAESIFQQDTVKSGKKKGELKFRKVEVEGELKIKWQERLHTFQALTKPDPDWAGKQTDALDGPVYSTGKDTVAALEARVEAGTLDMAFLKDFVKKSSLDKEIGTYYVKVDPKTGEKSGMLTCVQPADHMLHPKLNHVNTVTSRLSSADPNMQNIPRGDKSEAKKMFVSRFREGGIMIEADYSQLEVVVQGVLSRDTNLMADLNNKIDFHCKRVSATFKTTYQEAVAWCKDETFVDFALWKKRRTKAKNFSFQRAYGAGAKAIADATGMTVEEVEALIEAEERMYPGVVRFNERVAAAVSASAVPFQAPAEDGAVDSTGRPVWKTYRRGEWKAPTGTRYRWRSHDAPAFLRRQQIYDSFSPPEMKNYPVQGTGGEFVQAMLGQLWRRFVETGNYGGKAFLVNTVHDCVWIDCHISVVDQVCADVKRILESIPEFYNARHGMNIEVPFPVEVELGLNMNEMKHWEPGVTPWCYREKEAA